jgi:hypothetical protein
VQSLLAQAVQVAPGGLVDLGHTSPTGPAPGRHADAVQPAQHVQELRVRGEEVGGGLGPPSAVVAGRIQPVTIATWAANVLDVRCLLPMAAGVPAAGIFGAAAGAIGAALSAILPGHAGHSGQRWTASTSTSISGCSLFQRLV